MDDSLGIWFVWESNKVGLKPTSEIQTIRLSYCIEQWIEIKRAISGQHGKIYRLFTFLKKN